MLQEQRTRKMKRISVKCLLTEWVSSAYNCELFWNQKGNSTVGWYSFHRHRLSVSRTCSVLVGKFPLSPQLSTDLICKPNKLKFQTPGYTVAKRDWFIAIFMGYESIILNRIHSACIKPALPLRRQSWGVKHGGKNPFWGGDVPGRV